MKEPLSLMVHARKQVIKPNRNLRMLGQFLMGVLG